MNANRIVPEYPMFIAGQDVRGAGWTYVLRASDMIRDPIGSFNLKRSLELGRHDGPIPDSVVARCAWGGCDVSRRAVDAAAGAFPVFSRMPLTERLQLVRELREALVDRIDEVIGMLITEGHPRRLAEWEISGLIHGADDRTLEWYRNQFDTSFDVGDRRVQLVRKPDGVVCVNPPVNAAGSNGCLGIMALMAGNTLVVKAPRSTPLSVMFVYREIVQPILDRHGAPPGTLNIISGDSQEILRHWINSPQVDDIVYFGGSDVGLQVGRDCIIKGKKPVLELAGNDGIVVWKDADLSEAAKALSECFYGSAQICMVPKYALIHPQVAEQFIDELLAVIADIVPGFPEDDKTLLSPVLKTHQFYDFLEQAREAGCEIVCGGRRVDVNGNPSDNALFFEPTVIRIDGLNAAEQLSCVREETFFPLLPVVVTDDHPDDQLLDEVIEFVNTNKYGLRNSLWTTSPAVASAFADRVHNGGQLKINESHIAFHPYLASHGGTGRTGGPHGELNYVALRTTHLQGIVWGSGKAAPIEKLTGKAVARK